MATLLKTTGGATYKKTKKGAGRTTKYMNFGIDNDLVGILGMMSNKTRFVNDAIREKIKRENLAV